ncbi:MAG: Glucokinase [Alphaproteobacteria bacterium ADurb.Bin438]|nr:MAG: Glucokinase [Alphaproteobacteria bacterium ADurb.Bin438]
MSDKSLIADIGGTNARFALLDEYGVVSCEHIFKSEYFLKTPSKCVDEYFEIVNEKKSKVAVFAVAGPVFDGKIENIDLDFKYDIKELGVKLGFQKFNLVNDFVAQSLCVPSLKEGDFIKIGGGEKRSGGSIAVMGPGTGLGAGILVQLKDGSYTAVASEGGHQCAPLIKDDFIREVTLNVLSEKQYLCSEDLVSGRGLPNIFKAVKKINGRDYVKISNHEITNLALSGDEDAVKTFDTLFSLFGMVAGNFAISIGAVGGFYIAGGILAIPDITKMFMKSNFRKYFEDKGFASNFAKNMPTYLITYKNPAFLGLSYLVKQEL